MIIAWLGFFLLLGGGAVFWWFLEQPLLEMLELVVAMDAAYIPAADQAFMRAIIHWFPAMMAVGALIWVLVFSQRTEAQGYYG